MSVSVDQAIQRHLRNPSNEELQLVIGVGGEPDAVAADIRELPNAEATNIGLDTLRVVIQDHYLDDLRSISGIERIELDRRGKPL